MVAEPSSTTSESKKKFTWFSISHVGLERRLALAFWVMSFLPILLLVAAFVNGVALNIAIYPVVLLALVGYFFIARRIVQSVLSVTHKVQALSTGRSSGVIEVKEESEISELARSFNRINKELEQKIEELESSRQLVKRLLSRIGSAINSYEGIDNLLNLIIEHTAAAVGADMGNLMLVDGEKGELYVKTSWSNNGQVATPELRVKVGEGVAGWVARESRPMRSSSNAFALGFRQTAQEETAVLSVPLKLRDHPIGVITVLRGDPSRAFTEDDELLLSSIGSQVAVAIENYRLNLNVERTYMETIMALALAVEAKDPYSAGHSKRVGVYAMQIGEVLGFDEEMLRTLSDAGLLHDIGKIGIKDEILMKPSSLTPDEWKIMQQHPLIGEAIVKPVRSLSKVVVLVRHHHERYDGAGYPEGLKGDDIPMGARILAVADSYDSMITDRPYRKRFSLEETKAELRRNAGTQFDPTVVDAFFKALDAKAHRLAEAAGANPS